MLRVQHRIGAQLIVVIIVVVNTAAIPSKNKNGSLHFSSKVQWHMLWDQSIC